MPDIDLSREQYAYVEALRDELAEEVTYGTVRLEDAVQYLIDHHREDGDLDVEVDADLDVDPEDAAADGGQAVVEEEPDGDDEGEEGGDADDSASGAGGGGGPLGSSSDKVSEMMSLLDDHGDVWREADSGYEVDLPDGDTEQVQTKDDVRALLFQHHR